VQQQGDRECHDYDPKAVAVVQGSGSWQVRAGQTVLAVAATEQDAARAKQVVSQYSRRCVIGPWASESKRSYSAVFWEPIRSRLKVDFEEDCIAYEPKSLTVTETGPYWRIGGGSAVISASLTKAEADLVAQFAAQHQAKCFIGRGSGAGARFVTSYWKAAEAGR
jgi:hypothetical protein